MTIARHWSGIKQQRDTYSVAVLLSLAVRLYVVIWRQVTIRGTGGADHMHRFVSKCRSRGLSLNMNATQEELYILCGQDHLVKSLIEKWYKLPRVYHLPQILDQLVCSNFSELVWNKPSIYSWNKLQAQYKVGSQSRFLTKQRAYLFWTSQVWW